MGVAHMRTQTIMFEVIYSMIFFNIYLLELQSWLNFKAIWIKVNRALNESDIYF